MTEPATILSAISADDISIIEEYFIALFAYKGVPSNASEVNFATITFHDNSNCLVMWTVKHELYLCIWNHIEELLYVNTYQYSDDSCRNLILDSHCLSYERADILCVLQDMVTSNKL